MNDAMSDSSQTALRPMLPRDQYADPAAPVEISPPTVQFTTRGAAASVTFHVRSKRTGEWNTTAENFHPTQAELAAYESPEARAVAPGNWSDAGVEAAALDYMRVERGAANVVVVDLTPVQPEEPVRPTRLSSSPAAPPPTAHDSPSP